ncbi:unnamed protein product [Brachionus calyciflorus]|uniref:Adenylate kinase 8 n=1 Tax=Brachionus calyciflorus TaxID=104777 RepID=A0A813UPW6_9BILA|nr:unnamed protein product [Brachionus calyciflorus]
MDQTTKPLLIPPQFALYAEKHEIFELYQRMLSQLIIHKPEDPMQFLIDLLRKDVNSSATIVLGPPASGKKTLSKLLSKKTGAVLLNQNNLIESMPNSLKNELSKEIKEKSLQPHQWVKIIRHRVEEYDCVRKGWILENFPETRPQALALLSSGIFPKHTVVLTGEDSMLLERAAGKRVDPKNGDIYHTTFDWPQEQTIQNRLVIPEKYTEEHLVQSLMVYNRHIEGVLDCLKATTKKINVDQPKGDVFNQILDFISRPARSHALITPRILLIGPYGSGRRTQASALAKKYDIVNVSITNLIKEAVAHETVLGLAIKPHLARRAPIPDSLVVPLLVERLGKLDCVSRGWVLHGFPRNRDQAEALERNGLAPNRVFFMDIPPDSIMERITLRYLDPITGERYHMLFNPPPTQEIRDRLSQKSTDQEPIIRTKINLFYTTVRHMIDYYENIGIHINADQDPNTVFESIESGIVNPVPKAYDEDTTSS